MRGMYEVVQQEARRFEQELRGHGFTNADVGVLDWDGWRTQTRLTGPGVSNISALKEVKWPDPFLRLYHTQVSDLSPLTNIPLVELILYDAPNVSDLSLSVLHGMRLEIFGLAGTSVSHLGPLKGMPLHYFGLVSSRVNDLSVLAPMQLFSCTLISNKVSDITVIKGHPLHTLILHEPTVIDISALNGAPLKVLDIRGSGVRDLSPIESAPLERIWFTVGIVTNGIDVLRKMHTLKEINGMPAAKYWAQYDKTP